MANVKSLETKDKKMLVCLELSAEEYKTLNNETRGLIVLPTGSRTLNHVLTTGRLGNGNRIMVPQRFLESKNISKLEKKVLAKLFEQNGQIFLLIRLKSEPKKTILRWETKIVRR